VVPPLKSVHEYRNPYFSEISGRGRFRPRTSPCFSGAFFIYRCGCILYESEKAIVWCWAPEGVYLGKIGWRVCEQARAVGMLSSPMPDAGRDHGVVLR
jgi:hypothetical protein